MNRHISLVLLLSLLHPDPAQAEEWKPLWGRSITIHSESPPSIVQTVDVFNNLYVTYNYSDSIFFPDTTFSHDLESTSLNNRAVAKYNPDGKFIKALDIYSVPDGSIMQTYAVTDREGNLYICCEFSLRVFLLDTVINHGAGPYPESPDIFLAKFDADFNLKWVKTISGPLSDDSWGLLISNDDHLYLTSNHYLSGIIPESVSILGQETITDTTSFGTLIKSDLNGTIEWIKILKGADNIPTSVWLEMGQDQKIYYKGEMYGDLYVGQDTLIHPIANNGRNDNLLITFNQNGETENYMFHSISMFDFAVGMNGDIFFSTVVYDTVYIGQDTLRPPGNDTSISVIGSLLPDFQPNWYRLIKRHPDGGYIICKIEQHNDSLVFTAPVSGTIRFMDSTYVISNYYHKIFSGEFDPEGNLIGQTIIASSNDMIPYFPVLDNCRQIVVTGTFKGTAVIGPDTIKSYSPLKKDNFILKIERHKTSIRLGNDTIVCGEFLLRAPPGLVLYNWNNGLSDEPEINVTQTGLYTLSAANSENCWMEDSIFVEVIPDTQALLGNDTTIFRKDSLSLSVDTIYKSVLWSTGDTGYSILLRGNELGVGDHLIRVVVQYGACTISDSAIISVVNNPGTEEIDEGSLSIRPIPAKEFIQVEFKHQRPVTGTLRLQNPFGMVMQEIILDEAEPGNYTFHLSSLPPGIYFLVLRAGDLNKIRKFVISR